MNNKTNKVLIWLVVILIIVVIGLMSFIVYKEFLKDNYNQNNNNNNTSNVLNDEENNKNDITDINKFPQKSDNTVLSSFYAATLLQDEVGKDIVDDTENFKNISYTKNNIKYNLSCAAYNPKSDITQKPQCETTEIEFENFKGKYYYNNISEGCSDNRYLIITDQYIIQQNISGCGDAMDIIITNSNGEKIFTEENSVAIYAPYKINETVPYNYPGKEVKIAVVNNILYYVTYTSDSLKDSKLYFNSFDLSNLKKSQIQEFTGTPFGLD